MGVRRRQHERAWKHQTKEVKCLAESSSLFWPTQQSTLKKKKGREEQKKKNPNLKSSYSWLSHSSVHSHSSFPSSTFRAAAGKALLHSSFSSAFLGESETSWPTPIPMRPCRTYRAQETSPRPSQANMVSPTHNNSQHVELSVNVAAKMHSYSTGVQLGSRSCGLEGCYTGRLLHKVLML